MEYIEHVCIITLEKPESWLLWFDDFRVDEENSAIRIKYLKTVEKYYREKKPSNKPMCDYTVAIFNMNRWIIIDDDNKMKFKTTTRDIEALLSKLKLGVKEIKFKPILAIYKFDFDIHIMLSLIIQSDDIIIFNQKKFNEATIIINNLKIKVYNSLLSYRGDEMDDFEKSCEELREIYNNYSNDFLEIYKNLDKPIPYYKDEHKSIAYKTWYNAARQNQREWPNVTRNKDSITNCKNIIEFPLNSSIYYYHDKYYVGLAVRFDFNSEKYIPKLYKSDHLKNTNSILYKYIHGLTDNEENEKEILVLTKTHCNKFNLLDNKGKPIGEYDETLPSLPYNYKQILHDYKKLGRLRKGEIQDLTHIGIVNEKGDDIITYPYDISDYMSKTLETHRLMTFRISEDTNYRIIY